MSRFGHKSAGIAVIVLVAASASHATITWTMDLLPTSSTTVVPGGSVSYEIVGVLGGDANMGLALTSVDLHASYATPNGLPRALPGPDMYSFVRPWGYTNPPGPADDDPLNPSGYGGTPMGDTWLKQIGGGQNTIGNAPEGAPFPIGDVVLGIGQTPVQVAFGATNLPTVPGVYTLTLSALSANAITAATGLNLYGRPTYAVDAATSYLGQASFDITVLPEPASLLVALALTPWVLRRRRVS